MNGACKPIKPSLAASKLDVGLARCFSGWELVLKQLRFNF